MLAVGTIAFWILVFSYADFRWARARKVIAGVPVVVVRDGLPVEEVLRLERVPVDEILEGARSQGITNLRDISLGILEPDGRFSFLRRDEKPSNQEMEHHKGR